MDLREPDAAHCLNRCTSLVYGTAEGHAGEGPAFNFTSTATRRLSRSVSGGVKDHPYEQGFDLRLVPGETCGAFALAKSENDFCEFHERLVYESVPDEYVVAVAKVMVEANWHTYQVLTKRSDRLRDLLNSSLRFAANQEHIWWGVSVENRKYGLPRIENLQNAHCAIKFLSVEPLLEDLDKFDIKGIDWVIVGGESGHGARPMRKEWGKRYIIQVSPLNCKDFCFLA